MCCAYVLACGPTFVTSDTVLGVAFVCRVRIIGFAADVDVVERRCDLCRVRDFRYARVRGAFRIVLQVTVAKASALHHVMLADFPSSKEEVLVAHHVRIVRDSLTEGMG